MVDRADVINRHDEQTLVEKLDYRGATIGASHLLRGSLTETEKGLKLFTLVFEISTTRLAYAASLQINNFYIEDRACRNWQEQLLKANASQTELVLTAERFPERQAQIDSITVNSPAP